MNNVLLNNKISLIAKNEIKDFFRNNRFWIVSLFLIFILGTTFWIGIRYYSNDFTDRNSSQEKVWKEWLSQNDKNPHAAGHYGTYAFKPIFPFNIIENGLNLYTGKTIRIETHTQNPPMIRDAEDRTFILRQGEITIAFILQIFFPLLIIILAHNLITKEKEQETIRLIFCQGVDKKDLILGKLLGIIGILFSIIIPLFLVIISVILYQNNDTDTLYSLIIFIISYTLYFLIFIFLSISISCLVSTSQQALMILFCIWISVCILVPKVTSSLSEEFHPNISAYDFTEDIENETFQASYKATQHWDDLNKKIKEDLLSQYKVSTLDSVPVNVFGYTLKVLEDEGHAAYERNYSKMNNIFSQQNNIHNISSIFSPMVNIRFISMAISSSNNQEQMNFIQFSEQYRRQMMNVLNEDIMKNQQNKENSAYKKGQELWKKIPNYHYKKRPFWEVFSDYKRNLILLLGWLCISILLLIISTKRIKL